MKTLRLILAVVALSCAGTSPTVISASTLDGLGATFEITGALFNDGLKSGAVSPATYAKWAAFAVRFKASYPVARDLWKASAKVEDADTNAKVTALIAGFAAELDDFLRDGLAARNAFLAHPDGGT